MSKPGSYVYLIAQYHALLERFAYRYMYSKHMAYAVVKETFESLYEQGKLVPGPELRNLLKTTAIRCGQEIDAALARAEDALANSFQPEELKSIKNEK